MSAFTALIKRDLSLAVHGGAGVGIGLIFYLCLVILFPFGVGPNMKTLGLISPAIIWAGPLLSILLGLEKLFQPDVDDGTFDLYQLSPLPLEMIILAKAISFSICHDARHVAAAHMGLHHQPTNRLTRACFYWHALRRPHSRVSAARYFGDETTSLAPLYILTAISIMSVMMSCFVSARILRS